MSAAEGAQVVSLAERLKTRREQLGLSQAQAARELDVARTAYRLWEMEAAKPQPDRWQLISRWLGVSVTTMLLADDIDDDPGIAAAAGRFARAGSDWDADADDPRAYFAKLRTTIQEGIENRFLGSEDGQELLAIMGRAEEARTTSEAWEPARLQKRFRVEDAAPRKARQAVDFVGGDLPTEKLRHARLLASQLVSNSVKHGSETDPMIRFQIEVDRKRLRVEVQDGAEGHPEASSPNANPGYGRILLERLSSRWASERQAEGNLSWFEIDLPTPGAESKLP
jgi:transcriptional regulator with XRE-family HTH domain